MKIVLSFLLSIFLPLYLNAQNTQEKFLFDKMSIISDNFYEILNDDKNTAQMRKDKILEEVIDLFDFDLMARLSLDKNIKKTISKEQYNEFTGVFTSYIKNFYLDRIDLLKGTSSTVKNAKQEKSNRIYITATLDSKKGTNLIIYKFYKTKEDAWLIYDLEIANVSVLQSYRAQFSSYLSQYSFDDLLKKLKTQA
jgi:phospholipid transport system substrate-binding protein